DARGDVVDAARTAAVEHLDREQHRVGRGTGDAVAVVGDRRGDAGDVAAVTVVVVAVARAAVLAPGGRAGGPDARGVPDDLVLEVVVVEVDAGVDDRDRGAGPGRDLPRRRGADHGQVPLQRERGIVGVRRRGGRGRAEQDRHGDG